MTKNPNFRTLLLIISALFLSCLIFISDIICGNIFGSAISMLLIVIFCFAVGYTYSKFEKWNTENGVVVTFFDKKQYKNKEIGENLTIDELIGLANQEKTEKNIDNSQNL